MELINSFSLLVGVIITVYYGIIPKATTSIIILKNIKEYFKSNSINKYEPTEESSNSIFSKITVYMDTLAKFFEIFTNLFVSILLPAIILIYVWLTNRDIFLELFYNFIAFSFIYILFALTVPKNHITDMYRDTNINPNKISYYHIKYLKDSRSYILDKLLTFIPVILIFLLIFNYLFNF